MRHLVEKLITFLSIFGAQKLCNLTDCIKSLSIKALIARILKMPVIFESVPVKKVDAAQQFGTLAQMTSFTNWRQCKEEQPGSSRMITTGKAVLQP